GAQPGLALGVGEVYGIYRIAGKGAGGQRLPAAAVGADLDLVVLDRSSAGDRVLEAGHGQRLVEVQRNGSLALGLARVGGFFLIVDDLGDGRNRIGITGVLLGRIRRG